MLSQETAQTIIHDVIPKGALCHYTSIDTFINILSTNEIWFSDITETNDKTELVFFIDVIQQQAPLLIKSDKRFSVNQKNEEYFYNLFEAAKEEILSTKSYMLSLTSQCDTSLMWDSSYGQHFKGVCIKFNKEKLIQILCNNFLFNKVLYGEQLIRRHQLFGEGSCIFYNGFLPSRYQNSMDTFITDLIMCSRFFKHASFSPESEYRFISLAPFSNYRIGQEVCKDIRGTSRHILKVNFGALCTELGFKIDDLFDEIILGPKAEISIRQLQTEIQNLGFIGIAKKISISSCPLR